MRPTALTLVVLLGALAIAPACDTVPPVPATSDPEGKDLVKGAVVAATERVGGIRVYKIVHVDDYPQPIGWELHMMAYDPKVETFQEAAVLRKKGKMTVALDYLAVRLVDFLPRDHRVIALEPVSAEEMAPYLRAKDSSRTFH